MIGRTLGHYRIVGKIGAGGMGEVYRAHDDQLDRDVALKVLPPGLLADEAARKRFRKEALALARLNHPNIETVYEFSTEDGVDFLALELIQGSPLSEMLRRGTLPSTDTIPIAIQLARALAAAHEQHVVHRDLKPGNLMITSDGRLKVLDFGLARLLRPARDLEMTVSVSEREGTFSGTVPYMSPEQLRGEPADARSDIFSAGIVLYEMATGRRPFPQDHAPTLMGAILHEAPAPPSSLNPHIAPGLQAVILKSLEKDPSKRFQSARELLADLEQVSSGAAGPAAVAPRRTLATAVRHRALVAGAAVLAVASLIALTVGLNLFGSRDRLFGGNIASRRRAPASAAVHARRSVAVLGFKNLSGREDQAWLSTALSEMLATELAAGGQLRTIPGESVAQMKISLSLPEAESYGKETLSKIRMNLSADDVVVGSYVPLGGDQIRVDLRLQDADVGETLAAVSERGAVSQIDDLVGRAGASLRAKLGVGEVSPAQAAAAKAMFPSDPAAARLYSEGLMKLRAFDNLAARDLLVRAVAAEPTFALAHAALATAWSGLGHDRRAKDEGRQAFDLSKNLGQEDRLWVEGQYREAAGEREKAIEIFRTLFQSYPDNLEYGLRLVNAQALGGKGPDALTAVVALRRLPPPAGDDPRIGLAEALAAESTGDFKREQSAAARAAEKGRALGARLVTASALVYQCWAFQRLGQPNDAVPRCEEARRISEAAGDRHGVAKALNAIAATRLDQGDRAEAKTRFEEALAIARETGAEQSVATLLSNIGLVVWAEGDLDQAQKHFEQSLSISREINADDTASQALGNMGVVSALQGRLSQARARFEDALAIDRRSGVRDRAAIWLWDLGDIAYLQGDLGRANDTLGQAETLARETGRKFVSAGTLNVRGHILAAEDDLAGARRKFEEEQSLQKAMGARTTSNRVDLAALAIEEGQPAQVEATCRQVIQEFRAEKDVDGEILARAVLARALLAASRPTDASQEIAAAAALSARSQDRNLGLTFAIVAARVRAATGSPAEAVRSLEASLAEATTSGFVVHQFDARLALGEIEIRSGKATAGRARLGALEKDATARGFRLVARKAAAARQ